MLTESGRFLGEVRSRLKLGSSSKREIISELYTHFEDEVTELEEAGYSQEEATRIAAESFGSVGPVANELNDVHSRSRWGQTIIAALPHLVFALLFSLRQWSNTSWLVVILLCTIGVAVYGWQHNKPTWFFTWLGYALMPLVVVGFYLMEHALSLNDAKSTWWVWLLLAAYFPFIVWVFIHILALALRRDWLLGSLMWLPVLPIIGWFMTTHWKEDFLGEGENAVQSLEPWIALSFLTLAGIVVLFNRLKQRCLKAGALLVSGLAILIVIGCSSGGNIGSVNLVLLTSLVLLLFLGPALLDHRIADREEKFMDCLSGEGLHR